MLVSETALQQGEGLIYCRKLEFGDAANQPRRCWGLIISSPETDAQLLPSYVIAVVHHFMDRQAEVTREAFRASFPPEFEYADRIDMLLDGPDVPEDLDERVE